jgi:RimJ/RimL family protein N-acetyltransferase
MSTPDTDPVTGLPIGPRVVDPSPAPRPQRTTLTGRHVSLTALDPVAHAEALYAATAGPENERLWLYLFDGPFANRADFDAYLTRIAQSEDRLFYAILDAATGTAVGHACYLRIEPAHRCIEVGGILYAPVFQRTPGATEAIYLDGAACL